MAKIYKRIRELRDRSNYTQDQVAAALSISRGAYSNYENGIRTIPVEHLLALSIYMGSALIISLRKRRIRCPTPEQALSLCPFVRQKRGGLPKGLLNVRKACLSSTPSQSEQRGFIVYPKHRSPMNPGSPLHRPPGLRICHNKPGAV